MEVSLAIGVQVLPILKKLLVYKMQMNMAIQSTSLRCPETKANPHVKGENTLGRGVGEQEELERLHKSNKCYEIQTLNRNDSQGIFFCVLENIKLSTKMI